MKKQWERNIRFLIGIKVQNCWINSRKKQVERLAFFYPIRRIGMESPTGCMESVAMRRYGITRQRVSTFGLIPYATSWRFHTRLCLDSMPQTSCGCHPRLAPWFFKQVERLAFFYPIRRIGMESPAGCMESPLAYDITRQRVFTFGLIPCITSWWFHTTLRIDSIPQTSCGFHTRLRRDFTSCIFILWTHDGATILHPNTKVLDFGGLFVFFGGEKQPSFTIAPFPRPFGLESVTLWEYVEFIELLWYNLYKR